MTAGHQAPDFHMEDTGLKLRIAVRLRRLLAWLLLAPLAGGAGAAQLTLGLVAPPSEPDATSLLRGVQLAVAAANETGGSQVRLEVRSENGQWGTVGNDAVILVSERHVDAIIAPSDGGASHLILQVSGRMRVPVASLCSDSSVTYAGVPWAIRVVPRTDQEAEALFAAARRPDRSPLHWWAVVPAGRPGRAIRHDLETAAHVTATPLDRIVLDSAVGAFVPRSRERERVDSAPTAESRIVADGEPKPDLASRVHSIVAAAPDGVLIWLPPSEAGTLAAALRAADYGGRLAGPTPLDSPAFVAAAGSAATGFLVTSFRTDADLRVRAETFEKRFQQTYDAKSDFSAAAAYDAAHVLIETLRRAGEGDADRQFPLAFPIEGVTGVIHFDNAGNRIDALQVLTWQQGCFIPISPNDTKP
jgi:ABC-type branched-subunit amino acid transport system substrate-binding protein